MLPLSSMGTQKSPRSPSAHIRERIWCSFFRERSQGFTGGRHGQACPTLSSLDPSTGAALTTVLALKGHSADTRRHTSAPGSAPSCTLSPATLSPATPPLPNSPPCTPRLPPITLRMHPQSWVPSLNLHRHPQLVRLNPHLALHQTATSIRPPSPAAPHGPGHLTCMYTGMYPCIRCSPPRLPPTPTSSPPAPHVPCHRQAPAGGARVRLPGGGTGGRAAGADVRVFAVAWVVRLRSRGMEVPGGSALYTCVGFCSSGRAEGVQPAPMEGG